MSGNNKPKNNEFCWNELMTPNINSAKKFYGDLFGWQSQDHDMGNSVYTMFKQGDKDIGGMFQIPKGQENEIPPHWMSYVSVESLDNTVEKAKSLGAKITVPATQVGDFGRFSVIQDPTGAYIALWQSLKEC